jgi:hypothetical protein
MVSALGLTPHKLALVSNSPNCNRKSRWRFDRLTPCRFCQLRPHWRHYCDLPSEIFAEPVEICDNGLPVTSAPDGPRVQRRRRGDAMWKPIPSSLSSESEVRQSKQNYHARLVTSSLQVRWASVVTSFCCQWLRPRHVICALHPGRSGSKDSGGSP